MKAKNIFMSTALVTSAAGAAMAQGQTAQAAQSQAAKRADKPNIILIMADDLGYGDIGCFGNKKIKTPNIDRMAAEGIKMTDFHTNGSVSSPTRAALMTGRYQQRSGITGVITAANDRDLGLALSEFTMAEALKEQGYKTAMYGKWHLGYAPEFNPVHQGFDEFSGFVAGNIDFHSHIDEAMYDDWWIGDQLQAEDGYVTDLIGDKAVKFVEKHKDEPFFLYLPHEAPHYPIQGRNCPAMRGATAPKPRVKLNREQTMEVYQEMIEVMDETVGDLLAALEKNGIADNTLVIFTSDNGGQSTRAVNAPLSGGKGGLLEGGHRVSMVLWAPGMELTPRVPYVYTSTVMTMDLFPAFVDLAGGKAPKNLDGVNFLPAMKKGQPVAKRDLFWANANKQAMRRGEWKLIKNIKQDEHGCSAFQLFNLADDIGETNNLAAQYPKRAQEMAQAIDKWFAEVQPKK